MLGEEVVELGDPQFDVQQVPGRGEHVGRRAQHLMIVKLFPYL